MEPTSNLAGVYLRKSSDREGRELGISRQLEDCRSQCDRLGLVVADTYADNDISASTRSNKPRPEFQRLLRDIDAGLINFIVAYSTSRLTRRPMEFERLIELAEQGIRILTVKTGDLDLNTARGRRRARDDAARDAEYAEEISELLKRERQQRRERGLWNGGHRPIGFESDGMTPRHHEQALIKTAAGALLAGRSLASVARDWTAATGGGSQGAPKWRPSVVGDVLRNPRVAGLLPDERPAMWAPILDEPTWRGVVAVLANPARRRERGATRLLTGIAYCGVCGEAASVHVHGGMNKNGAATYRCAAGKAHLDRLAEPVDRFVTDTLLAYLSLQQLTPVQNSPDLTRAPQVAAGLRARLGELADLVADGSMTSTEYRPRADRLRRELEEADTASAAAMHTAALASLPIGLPALRREWIRHDNDPDWRRSVLRASGMTVRIKSPGRGVRRSDDAFLATTIEVSWPDNGSRADTPKEMRA